MLNRILALFLIGFLALPLALCAENTPGKMGAWITAFSDEKVTSSEADVDKLIETCKASGIDHIYLQIYRADTAYYDSDITDSSPYKRITKESKKDGIKTLLEKTAEANIKVYAWVNCLSISTNVEANILKKYDNSVLNIDQHGRTSFRDGKNDKLDKYYIRENQLFLDPGDWRVRAYVVSIIEEIITKYPSFSGVHLDYIRYPSAVPFIPGSRFASHGIDYGYGKMNTSTFEKETGLTPKTMNGKRENFQKWDDFRRGRVTYLVKLISEKVKEIAPKMILSCAVIPSIDRSYQTNMQDWTGWLADGDIDYVVTMNYTDDTRLFDINTYSSLLKDNVYVGVGAYLLKDKPEVLKKELDKLKKLSPGGIVIFSYDDVVRDKGLQSSLFSLKTQQPSEGDS